jgi:hypothetical protein
MTLTIELPEELGTALEAEAQAQGVSVAGFAQEVLERVINENRRPLSVRIREVWKDMPDDVRASLPKDGSSQIDHYVYGLPKREP